MNEGEESRILFESLETGLNDLYSAAVSREDLLSEEFDSIFCEIRQLDQRYGERTQINEGGLKKIYKAEDRTTGRPIAMALLKESGNAEKRERFLREARLTASLEHPNIMPVYDIGLLPGEEAFFTMKLTGGKNLAELLKERGPQWNMLEKLNLFLGICDGMAFAHSRHILHLDLKPANIQVGDFGEVMICDWGLGKVLYDSDEEGEGGTDPQLLIDRTLDGVIKGTPGYMAPEQIDTGLGKRDRRTDVFALGGILHTLLCGTAPFQGGEISTIFQNTLQGNRSGEANIPSALEAVVSKALNRNPQERYQHVDELKSEILAWLSGFATEAEEAGLWRNFCLLVKRHKTAFAFLMVILILATLFVVRLQQSHQRNSRLLALYEAEKKQTELIGKEAAPHIISQAWQALYGYNYTDAMELAEKAVARDSSNAEAWEVKGTVHFLQSGVQCGS